MNVFYVRPSNNGYYGIPEALGAGVRLRTSFFRSTQFPLSYPLPKRLDRDMQGWFGLQAYDLLVLAGIDPEVLAPKEMRDIIAFVEHGGGLLLVGGEESGRRRVGTWTPLEPVLPARFGFADDLAVEAAPVVREPDPLTDGLAVGGRVQAMHAIDPLPDARVLLEAGGQPLLLTATRGRGRVAFLNAWPQAARTAEGLFFTDRAFPLLLRRCCAWLAGRPLPVEAVPDTPAPAGLVVDFPDGAGAYAPGMALQAVVTGGAPRAARVLDPRGQAVHAWTEPGETLAWTVGDLAAGDYTLQVEAADPAGGPPVQAARGFAVVDPPDREDFFPFVTETFVEHGALTVSDDDVRRQIDDVRAHGFNVVTLGGVTCAAPPTETERVRRAGERYAQAAGLWLATHGNLVPDFSRDAPPAECVRDAEAFDRALRERVAPLLAAGQRAPRLFQMEILDEPLVTPASVCRCPRCLADFQARFGYPMPAWEATCAPGREGERTDLLAFVSDTWAEIFRRCYDFKVASGACFDAHHTFCQLTFGSFVSRYYWRDGFTWLPYCDRFDWDVYPYIYIHWRGHAELRCPNIRYHFAGHRALARFHGKPMGHWLDLSDRNVPHGNPPVRASSELLYTALGQDAKLVRTFYNLTFGRNNGARTERWDDLGAELTKIGRYAAVLTRAHRPPARLAMVFPATDWALRHHTGPGDLPPGIPASDFPLKFDDAPVDDWFPFAGPQYNAYELLLQAFGAADLLPEAMAALPAELGRHRALALWGARYLSAACAAALADFVRAGGLLLCDGVPALDERGRPLSGLAELFGGDVQPLCDELGAARQAVGRGATLLFTRPVNRAYSDAAVAGDMRMRRALEGAVRDFLAGHGVEPPVRSSNGEFEVDLLAGEECFFLVAVNHNVVDDAADVELLDPPSRVGWAVDMASGLELPLEDGRLRLALGERRGIVIGCYPERPVRTAVRVTAQQGRTIACEARLLTAAGLPAAGNHPLELLVRDPAGEVRARYGGRRATTGGVYRRTFTLAVNELPGAWEVEVRDPLTRTVARAGFTSDGDTVRPV